MITLLLHLFRVLPFLFVDHRLCLLLIRPPVITPLGGDIRDGDHPRVAPSQPCPGSAAAPSVARARPWPTTSVSESRCSNRRTPTGSTSDVVRRSPRHGQGIPVGSSQSHAPHRRFATASVA